MKFEAAIFQENGPRKLHTYVCDAEVELPLEQEGDYFKVLKFFLHQVYDGEVKPKITETTKLTGSKWTLGDLTFEMFDMGASPLVLITGLPTDTTLTVEKDFILSVGDKIKKGATLIAPIYEAENKYVPVQGKYYKVTL